ncbi:MAG: hypothetical protein V4450_11555 [Bacteroidota bacterium]
MEKRSAILNELKEISPLLAETAPQTPMQVPEGYFVALADAILEKCRIEDLLSEASFGDTFHAPNGYFDSLPGDILAKIQSQNEIAGELETVAPLLLQVSKQEVYTTPQGYFEETDFMTKARDTNKPGRVVTLRIARKWMNLAAAAAVTGVLISGAFLFTDKSDYAIKYSPQSPLYTPAPTNGSVAGDSLQKDATTEQDRQQEIADDNVFEKEQTGDPEPHKVHDLKSKIQLLSDDEMKKYLEENSFPEPTISVITEMEDSL